MTSQRSITDEWRARLAEYERELNDPIGSRSWLVRAYVKGLRFLLSFYRDQDQAASPIAHPQSSARAMKSWVAEPIGPGKPARSTESVRHTIDSIHEANAPGVNSGPLIDGLRPNDLVVVAQFTNWEELDVWLTMFRQQGYRPEVEHTGEVSRVKVPFEHYRQAKAMIEGRPLTDGLYPDDLVVVARFTNRADLDFWLFTFTQQGLCPEVEHEGVVSRVKVPFEHYPEAMALIEKRRQEIQTRRRLFNPYALEYSPENHYHEGFARFFVRFIVAAIGFPVGGTIGQIAAICFSASTETTEIMILSGAIAGLVLAFWYAGRWIQHLGE
jgi:hypothetical protein